ncbi:MAG TPA: WD40 repeat domain-containing protein, partial [Methanoregula sp.]|nr:WD40 repeat domain-containing protein [Methanoregula sp.]
MNCHSLLKFVGLVIVTILLMPAAGAVDPLWTHDASTSGELSGIVISADGSAVVVGGDQLIALTSTGVKRWTGWSGVTLAISSDGAYILTSRDQTVRLISGTGTMLWDMSLGDYVTEAVMMPDASLIAAGGGSRVRLVNVSGSGFRQNSSIQVRHIRFLAEENRVVITTKTGIQTSNFTLLSEWTDTNATQDLVEAAADGSSFVTVTNNRVRLYTADGSLQWDRSLPGGNALAFALSRDGSTIVIGRDDNTVQALDRNGTLLWTDRASHWITSVAVSDDGTTIAAGSMDKTLAVYDRAGTKLGFSVTKNPIKARSVAVSGDGSVIAAVDAAAVYGFSRSQFTEPVTPAVIPTPSPSPVTTPVPVTTPQLVTTAVATPVSSPAETPKTFLTPVAVMAALALVLFLRIRDP